MNQFIVDLRSDTFTRPSQLMRQAIANAEVGDDVFGEDPTVNHLQEKVAALLGKEAGLFIASGTMGNQVAINAHTQPGDEVVLEAESHILIYEAGGPALLSGVQLRPIPGMKGVITSDQIETVIRPDNVHFPPTRLICLENTHNRAGGAVFPIDEMERIRIIAQANNIRMHLDGARLWNASVATGIPLKDYGILFDSVLVCFSKGMGAPVGSVLLGDQEFINKAHRYRKVYGGGMRQVGILAAGALYALEHHMDRLAVDHQHAKKLAEALHAIPGMDIDPETVQTNIVIVDMNHPKFSAPELQDALKSEGVLILAIGPNKLRAVTHLDVTMEGIDKAILAFRKLLI
jgi:threonine aldolase